MISSIMRLIWAILIIAQFRSSGKDRNFLLYKIFIKKFLHNATFTEGDAYSYRNQSPKCMYIQQSRLLFFRWWKFFNAIWISRSFMNKIVFLFTIIPLLSGLCPYNFIVLIPGESYRILGISGNGNLFISLQIQILTANRARIVLAFFWNPFEVRRQKVK